ncbi:hypothetical protein BKA67DRAFT_335288 [Truncatella angustata]|uniref:Uncharacterized protein n=1 Tax=Truncatella angustata TaxID=152316 RepID=A0A9P8UG86_9PEZI|nr:uncharacterized protein BKA67DRAFT_335288 [Truncatella angustata]KAH6651712.1 hypothetical protein BKA67DRAFT_335288 [Truncatella angustata]
MSVAEASERGPHPVVERIRQQIEESRSKSDRFKLMCPFSKYEPTHHENVLECSTERLSGIRGLGIHIKNHHVIGLGCKNCWKRSTSQAAWENHTRACQDCSPEARKCNPRIMSQLENDKYTSLDFNKIKKGDRYKLICDTVFGSDVTPMIPGRYFEPGLALSCIIFCPAPVDEDLVKSFKLLQEFLKCGDSEPMYGKGRRPKSKADSGIGTLISSNAEDSVDNGGGMKDEVGNETAENAFAEGGLQMPGTCDEPQQPWSSNCLGTSGHSLAREQLDWGQEVRERYDGSPYPPLLEETDQDLTMRDMEG